MFNNELWQKPPAAAGGTVIYDYQIANSARFDGTSSYLYKTWGTAPTSTTKKTISVWIKRSLVDNSTAQRIITSIGNTGTYYFSDTVTDNIAYYSGGGGVNGYMTTRVFRDPSAWFHFVAIYDSGEASGEDRIKFYINGELFALDNGAWTFNAGYPNTSVPTIGKDGVQNLIGAYGGGGSLFNGYMADFVQIDGTAAISDFGETTNGVWVPKDPSTLTFGTNGFWLDFADNTAFGNDVSGNNNDWTATGFVTSDQMLDSPTFNSSSNGGNFATWNPLNKGSYTTLTEGNLKATGTSSGASQPSGTFAMTSGKWYWEMLVVDEVAGYPYTGLTVLGNIANSPTTGGDIWAMRYDISSGAVGGNSGDAITGLGTLTTVTTGVATATDGDIISYYLDCDNRKAWIAKNGVIPNSGAPASGTNPQWSWTTTPNNGITFTAQIYNGDDTILNAGQDGTFAGEKTAQGNSDDTGYGNFYYDPPTGFLAMCAGNLTTAEEVDPAQTNDDYPQKLFDAELYTGDGASTLAITGMDFQPDWTWIKNRDAADDNVLFDSTRGVTKLISTNNTAVESTDADTLKSWTSDGFTVGADVKVNTSGEDYVGWNWRANGGTTAANSVGGTSSVTQADPSGAFSIVTYTGFAGASGTSTVGHGMSLAPVLIIHIALDASAGRWTQSNAFTDAGYFVNMAGTGAETDLNSYGTMNAPTDSVFTINGVDGVGGGGRNYIAYCFANCEGYMKSGSFMGNGSTDGTFIYTGFKPRMIMLKRTNRSGDYWYIIDTARNTFNGPGVYMLNPDRTATEATNGTTNVIDFLSNGWKMRTSGSGLNGSGGEWVYLAISSNPFAYATAR